MPLNHKSIFNGLSDDFLNKKIVANLPLCLALLENNKPNPWVILVPKIDNIVELIDLETIKQHQLLQEINLISKIFKNNFNADKLNIASFGNITPQLHFHIIARYKNPLVDEHFPKPLFGLQSQKMTDDEQNDRIKIINTHLTNIL